MGQKIITEDEFWICTQGAIPTQFQGTRESLHNIEGEVKYITKEDTSTVGWLDFGCKKYMLLVALAAAIAVVVAVAVGVLTVATGGAGLILLGAIAGVVGGVIGAVVGGLLCGQKFAAGREWLDCKNNMILQGTAMITGEHVMSCEVGGIIRYAPNIKSWLDAIGYATLSYTSELVKCAFAGAAVGMVGTMLGVGAGATSAGGSLGTGVNFANRAISIAKPTISSVLSNIAGSFGIGVGVEGATIAIGSRLVFGGEEAAYTYATGGINRSGKEAGVLDEFAKGALPEYEFVSRISEQGLSGLQLTDALFLLYFLNLKIDPPGSYRDATGRLRNARNNPRGKTPGSYLDDPRVESQQSSNGNSFEDGDSQIRRNAEQGRQAEDLISGQLADEFSTQTVKRQITGEFADGKTTIFDDIVIDIDGNITMTNETKSGGAQYSDPQQRYRNGESVTITDPHVNGGQPTTISINDTPDRLSHVNPTTGEVTITNTTPPPSE